MDRKVPKTMALRNKNAPKVPESGTPEVGNQFGKDEVPSSNLGSSSIKSSLFFWKGWIFLMFQNFFCWFEFSDFGLTTQTATVREKTARRGGYLTR